MKNVRIDIFNRPEIIIKRQRIGDFEGDTMVGKGHGATSRITMSIRFTDEASYVLRFILLIHIIHGSVELMRIQTGS